MTTAIELIMSDKAPNPEQGLTPQDIEAIDEAYFDHVQRVAYNDNKLWAGHLAAFLIAGEIAAHLAFASPLRTEYRGLLSSRLPNRSPV